MSSYKEVTAPATQKLREQAALDPVVKMPSDSALALAEMIEGLAEMLDNINVAIAQAALRAKQKLEEKG
jgi:hypothetical protein